MTHPTDDPLREALDRVSRIVACSRDDVETFDVSDIMALRDAALAAAPQPEGSEDDYQLGYRDGYEQAVQDCDLLTGGNGEYFASTLGNDCRDPDAMKRRMGARWEARTAPQPAPASVVERSKRMQYTTCDDCGFAALPHDEAVWTTDGASYCRACRPSIAASPIVDAATAPADERAAMIDAIVKADDAYDRVQGGSWAGAIANALRAKGFGWTRGGDAAGLREAARELCDRLDEFSIRDGDFEGMVRDYLKNVADAHIALGAALARPSAPETLAWAVLGEDGAVIPSLIRESRSLAATGLFGRKRIVRVAMRVVEDGA